MTSNEIKEIINNRLTLSGEAIVSDFVMGYYLNPQTKKYDVYINNERGRQRIRKTTENELEALDKLVSMMEVECK